MQLLGKWLTSVSNRQTDGQTDIGHWAYIMGKGRYSLLNWMTSAQPKLMLLSFEHHIPSETCTADWVTWLLLRWLYTYRCCLQALRGFVPRSHRDPQWLTDSSSQAVVDFFPNIKFPENSQQTPILAVYYESK